MSKHSTNSSNTKPSLVVIDYTKLISYFIQHPDHRKTYESFFKPDVPDYDISHIIHDSLNEKYKTPLIGKLLLLILNNNVIGCALTSMEKNGDIYISNVFIHNNYRGKKYSYLLLNKIIKLYSTNTLILDVNSKNEPALAAYKKMKFEINQTKSYYKNNVKEIYYIMKR
jgi:ribosomal protein S18 acetylase RimI-like enzyme